MVRLKPKPDRRELHEVKQKKQSERAERKDRLSLIRNGLSKAARRYLSALKRFKELDSRAKSARAECDDCWSFLTEGDAKDVWAYLEQRDESIHPHPSDSLSEKKGVVKK